MYFDPKRQLQHFSVLWEIATAAALRFITSGSTWPVQRCLQAR
jgi:hypothetical protein